MYCKYFAKNNLNTTDSSSFKVKTIEYTDLYGILIAIWGFNTHEIFEILYNDFFKINLNSDLSRDTFPVKIYKILWFYEEMSLLHVFWKIEDDFKIKMRANKIVEIFIDSIESNNFKVVLCIFQFFTHIIVENADYCIHSMIQYLNRFTDNIEAKKYRAGVQFFEERLYLFELLIQHFSLSNAIDLCNTISNLVKCK